MKPRKHFLVIFSIISVFSLCAVFGKTFADEKKGTERSGDEGGGDSAAEGKLLKSFRCERFRSSSLADLKLKLIENCNLEKPFSLSTNDFVGDVTYLYCCHHKK